MWTTVTSSDKANPEDVSKVKEKYNTAPTYKLNRCGMPVKSTTASCEVDQSISYAGSIPFQNPPKATMLYFNSYEIIVTGGSAAKGEGLLFFPYLMKRIPVEWKNITITKGEDPEDPLDKDFGCIVGKDDKIQVQGSNPSVLSDDLNKQFTALAAWQNTPGSFTGTFGEALDSLKKSSSAEVIVSTDITKYSSAVIQGIDKLKTDINVLMASDRIPVVIKGALQETLDSLEIALNLLNNVKAKPLPIRLTTLEKQKLIDLTDAMKRVFERLKRLTQEKNTRVTFEAIENKERFDNGQNYIDNGLIDNMTDYEKLTLGDGKYYVPWLSIDYNQTISLSTIFSEPLKILIDAGEKVKFKASTNIFMNGLSEIVVDKSNMGSLTSGGIKILSKVEGKPNFNKSHNITVTHENGNVIGKVNIVTGKSNEISSKVLYADMNGTGFRDIEFSETIIETQLNTTHNVMFVKWKINKNQTEKINFQQEANSIGITTSGYAKDIDKIYEAKKGTGAKLEKLFLVTNIKNVKNNGFARRESRYLAILLGDLPTFTHECGHLLNLPHTFCCTDSPVPDNCSSVVDNRCMDKYATKNFMDYREFSNSPLRTHFDYYQWKTAYQWALKY